MTMSLSLYLLFVISWFLHLGARLPLLGAIRFDLVLVCILTILAFKKGAEAATHKAKTDTLLRALVLYSILTIPFVEWPGV